MDFEQSNLLQVERLWQNKLRQFQLEKEKEYEVYQKQQEIVQHRAAIIEKERERLLQEHLPYIQEFLPKGLLSRPDSNKFSDKASASSYR